MGKYRSAFKGLICQCYMDGVIKDSLSTKKKELDETLREVEKAMGSNELYCKLENLVSEFEMELEEKWFDYGASAREVVDYWNLGDGDEVINSKGSDGDNRIQAK